MLNNVVQSSCGSTMSGGDRRLVNSISGCVVSVVLEYVVCACVNDVSGVNVRGSVWI